MKGKDIRCPRCGEGVVDVAPDFDFASRGLFDSVMESWSMATCRKGHVVGVRTERTAEGPMRAWVEVVP